MGAFAGVPVWLLSTETNTQTTDQPEDRSNSLFLSTTLVCGQTGAVEETGIQQLLIDTSTPYTLHIDATQAVGKIHYLFLKLRPRLSFTHKFGGLHELSSPHQEKC